VPDGVPTEAAAAARDTLGGAAAAASELPTGPAEALLATARAAFTDGLRLAAVVGAVIVLSAAVLAAVLLRKVPPTTSRTTPEGETAETAEQRSVHTA
jgi:DHA2 family multidrug resistance protein-like MFS transporter